MTNTRGKATSLLLSAQIAFIILFALTADYDHVSGARDNNATSEHGPQLDHYYAMYQDVHVMMLIGFGFLMTFLKKHGFGSVGFNFLLTAVVIQWALIVNGYFVSIHEGEPGKALLSILSLLEADFAVATVLISFGAILGVASPVQLIVMALLEVVFYNVSYYLGIHVFKAVDVGGSMFIHTFGAYFGLAVSLILSRFCPNKSSKEESDYKGDMFAMIGTLFLWIYWPSFNAGPTDGNERQRAVINTVLSLSACCTVTFAVSSVVDKKNKLNMVHIQNATLAGGVAVGASANLITTPVGAIMCGVCGGLISTLGYQYLQPRLENCIGLHDTCGVHNLHGMPGITGAVLSSIFCVFASRETYKDSVEYLFGSEDELSTQPQRQIFSLLTTLGIALASGAVTGLIMSAPFFDRMQDHELFDDDTFWMLEEEEGESNHNHNSKHDSIEVKS